MKDRQIAEILLDIGAVSLSPQAPFTWASGIKSPIYCDNRLILSYPKERRLVEEALADLIIGDFPQVEAILSTATAGIPHGSIAAWILDLPSGFIRAKAKDHGRAKQVEGAFKRGQKVVVVEDLFSTGTSSIEAAQAARDQGLDVLGIVSIFTYSMEASRQNFAQAGFEYRSLSNFPILAQVARQRGVLTEADLEKLEKWRQNPQDQSWIQGE